MSHWRAALGTLWTGLVDVALCCLVAVLAVFAAISAVQLAHTVASLF